ncbi:hypothetical protein BOTBODRAFT_216613 [Botryobasidium botryosum FD-172 SS1]|uniref:Uncharacterized protein n=1 Tax=Botryobasidium botryosum (strain FD-172 SS1) TaxID=930990 RepID=A0A067NDQ7_BOTB1|nr:hypothetical protein BOTBODRAFT_216613 [Botryobasidium botryosum FD-172 SS1]
MFTALAGCPFSSFQDSKELLKCARDVYYAVIDAYHKSETERTVDVPWLRTSLGRPRDVSRDRQVRGRTQPKHHTTVLTDHSHSLWCPVWLKASLTRHSTPAQK